MRSPYIKDHCLCTVLSGDELVSKEIVKKAASAVHSLSENEFNITFNTDVFQQHVKHANPEVSDPRSLLPLHSQWSCESYSIENM